jgi:uncharacterized protein (TIGR02284 family)
MADLIDTLNDLIATCRNSEDGFGKAAKGVHSDNLRTRFTGIAQHRAEFADELAPHVHALGGAPAESGHQSGIQHRGWRDLEVSIRPRDDASILAACQTGEQNTVRHYTQALARDLPMAVRAVVNRQRLAIEETVAELATLEHVRHA